MQITSLACNEELTKGNEINLEFILKLALKCYFNSGSFFLCDIYYEPTHPRDIAGVEANKKTKHSDKNSKS